MAKRPSPRRSGAARGALRVPPERWDAARVRSLRRSLALSQQALAHEMGIRQQTVSDWETGIYTPSPLASTMLNMLAEQAQVQYEASSETPSERRSDAETESS